MDASHYYTESQSSPASFYTVQEFQSPSSFPSWSDFEGFSALKTCPKMLKYGGEIVDFINFLLFLSPRVPGMSAQMGLKQPPQRHNNRLLRVIRPPTPAPTPMPALSAVESSV
jgi:hypothetical protein